MKKIPTIEECYKAIPFLDNEHDCSYFVAGIAECHKYISSVLNEDAPQDTVEQNGHIAQQTNECHTVK